MSEYARVGIAVSRAGVAVASNVEGRKVVEVTRIVAEHPLPETFGGALRSARRRSKCAVTLGPTLAQVRRVRDLPAGLSADMVHRVLSQSPERFFVGNGDDIVVVGVDQTADGSVWAWAVDREIFASLQAALRAARLRAEYFLPASSLFFDRNAIAHGEQRLQDGHVAARLSSDAGGIASEWREWSDEPQSLDLAECAVRVIADRGRSFLAAPTFHVRRHRRDVAFLRGAAVVAAVAFVFLLAAPAIARYRERAALSTTLSSYSGQRRTALAIDSLEREVHAATAFDRQLASARLPIIGELAAVSRAIGETGLVKSFHVDSAGLDVSAQVSDAIEYLDALDASSVFAAIAIVGSISSVASSRAGPTFRSDGSPMAEPTVDRVSIHLTVAPKMKIAEVLEASGHSPAGTPALSSASLATP